MSLGQLSFSYRKLKPAKKRGRKRDHGQYEVMTENQEKDLIDFFQAHPQYYDQSPQGFKLKTKKEHNLIGYLLTCNISFVIDTKSHCMWES
jgi:hypothetical protein